MDRYICGKIVHPLCRLKSQEPQSWRSRSSFVRGTFSFTLSRSLGTYSIAAAVKEGSSSPSTSHFVRLQSTPFEANQDQYREEFRPELHRKVCLIYRSESLSEVRSKSATRACIVPPKKNFAMPRPLSRDDARLGDLKDQQNLSTSIIGLEVDDAPFFYATHNGGLTSGSLLVVTSAGHLIRIHTNAPQETPPSTVRHPHSFLIEFE
jgi:hypothetical protein